MRPCETLDKNGNFTMENLLPEGPMSWAVDPVQQQVRYVLKQGEQAYHPWLSFHGFRYVRLSGWPEKVRAENVLAVVIHSDMASLGKFECSHPHINQLIANTRWSQKGKFVDIPTDCPTRERAGWTGDIAAFCEAGSYLMDTGPFLKKWLRDLAAQQKPNGKVASIVPDVGLPGLVDGSAGWGDAAVIVPHTLYRMYGDRRVLEDQYDSMCRWLGFVERRARRGRRTALLRRDPDDAFIVNRGYHWGDWLEPGDVIVKSVAANFLRPDAEVATAYFAYSAGLLTDIAEVLGEMRDRDYYRELSVRVRAAYRRCFTRNGIVESSRHCRLVRPIALDLLPEAEKRENARLLDQKVRQNDYRIGTGFLTTPFVFAALSDYGYVETAYRMVESQQRPGWLYPIKHGATTIWENWNGVDDSGRTLDSHNHYAFGAVTAWFLSRVAGIQPLEPGFRRVRIQPAPGGSLRNANCTYESAAGKIRSDWSIYNGHFYHEVEIPVEADLLLPNGEVHQLSPGRYKFSQRFIKGYR